MGHVQVWGGPGPSAGYAPLTNSSRRLGAMKGARAGSSGQGTFSTPRCLQYGLHDTRFAKLNPNS